MYYFLFDTADFSKKQFRKNDIIKNEGEVCSHIGLILQGSINIANTNTADTEFVIQQLSEGDMFGETLIFSDNNHYPGYIYALTDTIILYINKDNFIKKISYDERFKLFYLNYISNKFIKLQERLKILSQPSISDMFLYFMKIELSKSKNNFVYIPSISKLASYLNIPRPSLSRCISKLIDNKVITKNNKKYYILNKKHSLY